MEAQYPKLRHILPVINETPGLSAAAQRTPYHSYFTGTGRECQVELHNFVREIAKNYAISPKPTPQPQRPALTFALERGKIVSSAGIV